LSPTGAEVALSQPGHWLAGRAYTLRISRTGGTQCGPLLADLAGMPGSFTWTASAASADLAGTFAAPGKYRFSVKATCADGSTQGAYTIEVGGPMTMLAGRYLPPCTVGVGCVAYLARDGVPAYAARVTSGALPAGCELVAGRINNSTRGVMLACMAAVAGAYTFDVAVTDGLQESLSGSYSLLIGPPGRFYTSQNLMAFSLQAGGAAQTQPIGVGTNDLSVVDFTVSSDAPWLTATATAGNTPASINVQADPALLAAGPYEGHVTLTPAGGLGAVTVTVTAVVSDAAPMLGAAPDSVEIEIPPGDEARAYTMSFGAWNSGTLGLTAAVSVITSSAVLPWLSVDPAEVSLGPGEAAALTVQVDASQLRAGTHQGWVQLRAEGQGRMIPVTVVVPKTEKVPILSVSKSAWASGPIWYNLNDTNFDDNVVNVMNDEWSTMMDFTASVEGLGGWGSVHPAVGSSTGGTEFPLNISINQAQLGPGRYEGLLTVVAPGAKNSPSYSKVVHVLTQEGAESGSSTPVAAENESPVVTGEAGATAQIKIVNPGNWPVQFSVVCPGGELLIDNPSGVAEARSTATVTARVNESNLSMAERKALWETRMWGLANSTNTSQQLQSLVLPSRTGGMGRSRREAEECSAARLFVAPAAPANYFQRQADWPLEIRAVVMDDCGHAVTDAGLTASFSNGDASVALTLSDAAKGMFRGMWTPGNAGNVTVTLRAMRAGLSVASEQIFGAIVEVEGGAVLENGGIVNFAYPVTGAPASPGAVVVIRGRNLVAEAASAEEDPLPRQLGGATVLIGGIEAPLFSVSPEQIKAQVPVELAADEAYSVVIRTGDRVTTPKRLRLALVSPGIMADGDGRALAEHADSTPVSADAPVMAGEEFVLYAVGMGLVSEPVPSGMMTPESLAALVLSAPAVTLGGKDAVVVSAMLAPGGVGLYKVVIQAPPELPAGDLPLVLTQEGVAANLVTVAVGQ